MFKSFTASDKKLAGKEGSPGEAPPVPVRRAVRLMQAGAACSTISLILTVIASFSLKSNMMTAGAAKLKAHQITASQISSTATALIAYTVIVGLFSIGLWLWMARKNEAGRIWARITASVFFALWSIYTYSVLGELTGGSTITGTLLASIVLILALWVIGAATIYFLWRPASGAYFRAQSKPSSGPQPKARSRAR
jgi:uncharacterized membrane protein (DUF2068 family)